MGRMISWGAWEGAVTGQEGNGERVLLVEGEQQQGPGGWGTQFRPETSYCLILSPSARPRIPLNSRLTQNGQSDLRAGESHRNFNPIPAWVAKFKAASCPLRPSMGFPVPGNCVSFQSVAWVKGLFICTVICELNYQPSAGKSLL